MQSKSFLKFLWIPLTIIGIIVYFYISRHNTQHDFSGIGDHFQAESTIGQFSTKEISDSKILLFFGFTSCPDVCPITMSYLVQAQKMLDEQNKKTTIVLVTSDPKNDDVATLKNYIEKYNPINAIGVTGTFEEMEQIAQKFNVNLEQMAMDAEQHANMKHDEHANHEANMKSDEHANHDSHNMKSDEHANHDSHNMKSDEQASHDPNLHTDRIFVVGSNGKVQGIYTTKIPANKFVQDVINL